MAHIERGRRLVLLAVFMAFWPDALSIFLSITSRVQIYGILILPLDWELVVRLALESIFLYCVYQGYTWARWMTGILFALGTLLGLAWLSAVFTQHTLSLGGVVFLLMTIASFAIGAVILLTSSSVRSFQSAQRNPQMKAQLKPTAARIRISAGEAVILLVFCLLGCILAQALSVSRTRGVFAQWHPLGTPSAEEIQIVGALSDWTTRQVDVFVRSRSGQIFRPSVGTGGWVETTLPPQDRGGSKVWAGWGSWPACACGIPSRVTRGWAAAAPTTNAAAPARCSSSPAID